jgi:small conductance mechanosensitive channel
MALFALTPTLPAVAAMQGEVKDAIPALTVMMVNGAWSFLIAVLILIAGWVAARWIGRWVHDLIDRSHYIDDTLKPLISNFAAYVVLTITVVAVLSQFGVQTTSLIALLGAAGLAIGLALQGTLSNVASGVMLLILRPFRVYEKIKAGDVAGTVREIGLFRTEIVTEDGNFVSIPNATLFSGIIVNVSRENTRRTNFTVEIDRDESIDAVQKNIVETLERDPKVLKAPAPVVQVDMLGPISTTLTVHAWVQNSNYLATVSDLKKRVREALQSASTNAPVPVAPPAVAPWTPGSDDSKDTSVKPN